MLNEFKIWVKLRTFSTALVNKTSEKRRIHTRMGWKVHMMTLYLLLITLMTLYLLLISPMGQRHCNDGIMNLIWSHSMGVSWLAYELFSRPSYLHTFFLSFLHTYIHICSSYPWYYGCRRRKWTRRLESKSWKNALCISYSFGKCMNPLSFFHL